MQIKDKGQILLEFHFIWTKVLFFFSFTVIYCDFSSRQLKQILKLLTWNYAFKISQPIIGNNFFSLILIVQLKTLTTIWQQIWKKQKSSVKGEKETKHAK